MAFSIRTLFQSRAQALVDKGIAAESAGNAADAKRNYAEAIAVDPDHAAAHCNLGLLHLRGGNLPQAESAFRTALRLKEDFPDAWMGLAEALEASGRNSEALAALLNIPQSHASYDHALHARIEMLGALGRRGETVPLLFEAVARQPDRADLRRSLAQALHGATLGGAGERERAVLARLCADDDISTANLATTIAGILKDSTPRELAADPLLLAALPRTSFADPVLEASLTRMRRGFLFDGAVPLELACALARHCFLAEYAFIVAEDERTRVAAVRAEATAALAVPLPERVTLEPLLVTLALYEALHTLPGAGRLPELSWSTSFQPLVEEQVAHRAQERELAATIEALTPIADGVSQAVRAMYEENPYPPWANVQHPGVEPFEALSLRLRPAAPIRPRPAPPHILIAGCGTGLHPIQVARGQPASEILAVDLSMASLAYAARMAKRFGVSNITFAQADILRLGALGRKFAIVESVGVLHHLQDPLEGWKVLAGLLEYDGLMRIALYSTRARSGIRAARDLIQSLGLPATPEGIRAARRALMALPPGHPARDALAFGDFYTLNGCRDLLMHVQEHTFTLPQVAECLATLGLRLLKIECDALAQGRFRAMFPDASADADPLAWDRLEAAYPETFRGMIQFWCAR
jgi:tetratricopeptide (TPR) repeat protein